MRQKDDHSFAQILNRLHESKQTHYDISVLKATQVTTCLVNPHDTHLFTTIKQVNEFNDNIFNTFSGT